MPSGSITNQAIITIEQAENLWEKAKKVVSDAGKAEDYVYIVEVLKQMIAIDTKLSEKDINEMLFNIGYPVNLIVEGISPSDASSMRTNVNKIASEIKKIGTDDINWTAISLHFKLLLQKWLKASTRERGFFSNLLRRVGILRDSVDNDAESLKILSEVYNLPQSKIKEIFKYDI